MTTPMKICRLAILMLLLLEFPVSAQPGPIYFIERDWSFRIGGGRFGLYQDRLLGDEKYGAGRHTTLYFGKGSLRVKTRTFQRTTFPLLAVAVATVAIVYMLKRRGARAGPNEPTNPARY